MTSRRPLTPVIYMRLAAHINNGIKYQKLFYAVKKLVLLVIHIIVK